MKKLRAISVAIVAVTLLLPGLVHAQDLIAISGVLQAADCQTWTLTLKTADGAQRLFTTTSVTGVYVNTVPVDRCTLPQYAGRDATVWVTPAGDLLVAGRVDISVRKADAAQAAPGYLYGAYGYGPYGYGPYFDPYYNPYLNYDPFYYGTYVYPFGIGINIDGHFHDRDFDRGRFDRGDRGFHRGDRGGALPGGFSGAAVPRSFPSRSDGHGGGRR